MSNLNIVIPLAGLGSRFTEANYTFPKPLIDVNGSAMIAHVIENLKPINREDYKFIFIVQKEHCEKYDLEGVLNSAVGSDHQHEVIKIDGITKGAACTVLLASDYINNDDELMLANSDQLVMDMGRWFHNIDKTDGDGLIMTFKANHPKWSYAKTHPDSGRVLEVAEKKVISNNATTGIYWFRHGRYFVAGAESMIEKDIRTNDEFYVCPVYNELIIDGKEIYICEIEAHDMHGLGTPEDLEYFINNTK